MSTEIKFSRVWAMPNSDTMMVPEIRAWTQKYNFTAGRSVDPFARNCCLADWRNDINPMTTATYHMDAEDFLKMLYDKHVQCDLVIFDPPYSNEQMSRSYKDAGFKPTQETTQNGAMYSRVRDAIPPILTPDGIVLSFGWNSVGMGKKHGFTITEIMLVCHGGAHNDTICMAERRLPNPQQSLPQLL